MRTAFHEELDHLEAALQEEGSLVLRALRGALNALEQGDVELADEVVVFDDEIDRLYVEIEQGIESLLARQTPVATDLRRVLAMLHVSLHLERMADYCVTVAKLTKLVAHAQADGELIRVLVEMGERAEEMTRVALDSFANRDLAGAQSLVDLDELIDRSNRRFVERVIDVLADPAMREWILRMVVVSRTLERIGDHAVDIGEQTAYLLTAEFREFTDASHPESTSYALRACGMRRPFRTRPAEAPVGSLELALEAERGRRLVEESREFVVVLDDAEHVIAASRRARESLRGIVEGAPLPSELLGSTQTFAVPYEVGGRPETLLYLRDPGDLAAYEELRAGFTAAVSHELRTPLARLLVLLESASLPGVDVEELVEQARAEVGQIRELIDDVLFLSELETGREVVALGRTEGLPIVREVVESLADAAARAGVALHVEGGKGVELPLRPRMLRTIAANLAENAIRHAGPGSTCTLSLGVEGETTVLSAADDGIGVSQEDLPRLFERFYRADRARASRGTGLGLAIVKHVVSAAGGTVEASGERGKGLTIRLRFPLGPVAGEDAVDDSKGSRR